MNYKVSIIIAAYNIEKYIYKCIESIKNQTMKEIEIIVVNDGSDDDTLNIIKSLAIHDKRIKIIDKKNGGLIEARKSGLNIAKGEYVLFVDGDDWLELDALEKLYKNAIENNLDILIYNAYLSYDNRKEKFNVFSKDLSGDILKDLLLCEISPCIWSKLIKLEYIKNNNIEFVSNISYAEDLATTASLFMHNPNIGYINDHLYNYYQRENSITKIITDKVLEIYEAMKFIKRKMQENMLYNEYRLQYEYLVYMHIMDKQLLSECYKCKSLGRRLHKQYKCNKINIRKNKYIKEKISKYPLSQKIRINAYCKSYNLGRIYDKIRNIKKGYINEDTKFN